VVDLVPAESVAAARVLAADMEQTLQASWARVPRGSGPGPMGYQYEHWIPVGRSADSGPATARMLSLVATGSIPAEAGNLLFAAKLSGLAKANDGTRVVASGGVPRRLLAKALQKVVTAAAEELPDFVFLHRREVARRVLSLDEGCPLSPAFVAILSADPLSALRQGLQVLYAKAEAVAHLDDIHFWVPPEHLEQAMQLATQAVGNIGLEPNVTKTKLWLPSGAPAEIPAALLQRVVPEQPCLGSSILFMRIRRLQVDRAQTRLAAFAARLDTLIRHGLAKHDAWIMFANLVNDAVTYAQRAQASDPQQWRRYDDQVAAVVENKLGGPLSDLSRKVLFVPAKLGGGGLASAESRTDAVFLGSWAQVEAVVCRLQRVETPAQSEQAAPILHQAVRAATERVQAAGGSVAVRTQKTISQSLVARRNRDLRAGLEDDAAVLLHSQEAEGGAWLRATRRDKDVLSDDAFCVCLRRRLLFEDLAAQGALPCMLRGPRRAEQLAELRCRLAVALQRGVAASLLAASAGAARPWQLGWCAIRR
ncbi:unnamed protein product, partial [Prorocentrum cordatum]